MDPNNRNPNNGNSNDGYSNNGYPRVYPRNYNHPSYSEREQNEYRNFVGDDMRNEPGCIQGTFYVFTCIS
jgi:hypothetical protein